MTIKEALLSTVSFNLPNNRIDKALIDADLIADEIYSKDAEKGVDLCMAGLLLTLLTVADVTEDDVSIKLPSRDVLLKVYATLLNKWGVINPLDPPKAGPTVKQVLIW